MDRILEPELLDALPSLSPEAVRSRRDLRRLNWLLRTEAWSLKQLFREISDCDTVIELGAGEGVLLESVHRRHPLMRCIGYDFVPRPTGLSDQIEWVSGDFMERFSEMPLGSKTVVLANLILHHFDSPTLARIGAALSGVRCFLAVEPDRSKFALQLGRSMLPFVSEVTRFDMMVSIRAGFQEGELGDLLGMSCLEESTWLGGRRLRLQ
ncbi:MAG: class I SAM-dependent methyltransferase [Verrucomicrobiota bacterium]